MGDNDSALADLKAETLSSMRDFMAGRETQYSAGDIEACGMILDRFIQALNGAATTSAAQECVRDSVLELNELNERCGGELIETGQRETICAFLNLAAQSRGCPPTEDITEPWHQW